MTIMSAEFFMTMLMIMMTIRMIITREYLVFINHGYAKYGFSADENDNFVYSSAFRSKYRINSRIIRNVRTQNFCS